MSKVLVLLATLWMALIVGAGGTQLLQQPKANTSGVMDVYTLMHSRPL